MNISKSLLLCSLICTSAILAEGEELVNVQAVNPEIKVDLYFASTNNFFKCSVYGEETPAYLTEAAAEALSDVQEELQEQGLRLVVRDAYRSAQIHEDMWKNCEDEELMVNPEQDCCTHTCGIAVDVTIEKMDGTCVAQPSEYFEEPCDCAFEDEEVKANYELLKSTMEKHGFASLSNEPWFHFEFKTKEKAQSLTVSFAELAQQ